MYKITVVHVESGVVQEIDSNLALIMAATPNGLLNGFIFNDDPKQSMLLPQLAYNAPIAVNDYLQMQLAANQPTAIGGVPAADPAPEAAPVEAAAPCAVE